MKKAIHIPIRLLLFAALMFTACRKKDLVFTEAQKPLNGQWKITKVIRNGEDLTTQYDFTAFRINFQDSAYTLTAPVPFVVSKNGTWHFDDPQYPMELSFTPQGATASVKPVFRYPVVKGKRNLVLTFSPGCTANKYEYTLEPLDQ